MAAGLPEWFHPGPPGGWTADMLDHLPPGAPRHVELIDSSLLVWPPQTGFHLLAVDLLTFSLAPPGDLVVAREMTVTLGERQRPRPDVLLVDASAFTLAATTFQPADVHLAVEVASAESLELDRTTKPIKYAAAGIRHFWRVERQEDDRPVVHTFELEPATRTYVPTGVHRDRLRTYLGFPVDLDLDLTAVRRRPTPGR
ncbi:Uma2 family endonuclease [Nonomuraea antri]|uniref:Uma2 family endonuclease n=1 Tax=Nonomuraea antri TaxID=2730852 RepID=UPI0015698FD1|nr:Uma2 family endonuclease [Nonomuraea antri]